MNKEFIKNVIGYSILGILFLGVCFMMHFAGMPYIEVILTWVVALALTGLVVFAVKLIN